MGEGGQIGGHIDRSRLLRDSLECRHENCNWGTLVVDRLTYFMDSQLLRIEQFLARETRSERINRELQREAAVGAEAGEKHVIPFTAMRQTAAESRPWGSRR